MDDIRKALAENSDLRAQALEFFKNEGYTFKREDKCIAVKEALSKRGCVDPFVTTELTKHIYAIADKCTNNFIDRGTSRYTRKTLPESEEKRAEYIKIVDGIIEAIFPYYGMLGFRERLRGNANDQ